jgi:hypothetical protein
MQMFERCYELTREISYKNEKGELHREDGPALIKYHKFNNTITKEVFYKNGLRHREDGPALIKYFTEIAGDVIKEEYYYKNDLIHREDGPAFISYNYDSKVTTEQYLQNDKFYRENGPNYINTVYDYDTGDFLYKSFTYYDENCQPYSKDEDTPAYYLSNGDYIYYYKNKLHRIKGPARYNSNNENEDEEEFEYFIYGKQINKKLFYILKRRLRKYIQRYKQRKRQELKSILFTQTNLSEDVINFLTTFI